MLNATFEQMCGLLHVLQSSEMCGLLQVLQSGEMYGLLHVLQSGESSPSTCQWRWPAILAPNAACHAAPARPPVAGVFYASPACPLAALHPAALTLTLTLYSNLFFLSPVPSI